MFHAARALVLSKGYRERGHHCPLITLRTLWVETEGLAATHVLNLALCMDIRHEADYGHTFSHDSAMEAIRMAREMLEATRSLLGL